MVDKIPTKLPTSPQDIIKFARGDLVDVVSGVKGGQVFTRGGGVEFRGDGTVGTISGGGGVRGGGRGTPETEEGLRLLEQTRQAGIKRLEEEAARKAASAKLIASLRAGEDIRKVADRRGRGFPSQQFKRELRKRGTSAAEFKRASRAARRQFKQTGITLQELIRETPEKIKLETKEEIKERIITGATLVDVVPELSLIDKIKFSSAGDKIAEILRRAEGLLPTIEDIAPTPDDKTPGFIVETKDFAFGQGTPLTNIRPETLAENLGLKETSEFKDFEKQANFIQDQVAFGQITEEQGAVSLEAQFSKFQTNKAFKDIPKNLLIGAALGALTVVPIVGPAVSAAFAANLVLNRRNIVNRIQDFPKAFAIESGSFLVGGLSGASIGRVGRGRIQESLNIKPDQITSVTRITSGNEIQKISRSVSENSASGKVLLESGRISSRIAYEIKLSDGRSFKVIEFAKTKPDGTTSPKVSDRIALGIEVGVKRPERIIARGIGEVTRTGEEGVLRVVRFKPSNSKIVRFFDEFGFKKGKVTDVLQRSKVVKIGKDKFEITTESKIAQTKNINKLLRAKLKNIALDIKKGRRVSPMKLRSIMNFDRKLKGLTPLTKFEFDKILKGGEVSTQIINRILKNVELDLVASQKRLRLIETGEILSVGEKAKLSIRRDEVKLKISQEELPFSFGISKKLKVKAKGVFELTGDRVFNLAGLKEIRQKKSTALRLSEERANRIAKTNAERNKIIREDRIRIGRESRRAELKLLEKKTPEQIRMLQKTTSDFSKLSLGERFAVAQKRVTRPRVTLAPGITTAIKGRLVKPVSRARAVLVSQFNRVREQSSSNISRLDEGIRQGSTKLRLLKQEEASIKRRATFTTDNFLKASLKDQGRKNLLAQAKQSTQLKVFKTQRLTQTTTLKKALIRLSPPIIPRVKKQIIKGKKPEEFRLVPKVKSPNRFQVFTRRRGKDMFRESFKTKPSARKQIRRRLAQNLDASGFIFDKKRGVSIRPKIVNKKIYRISKVDKFRLVERKRFRLDTKSETQAINLAKRQSPRKNPIKKSKPIKLMPKNSKAFKPDGSSMSKKMRRKK